MLDPSFAIPGLDPGIQENRLWRAGSRPTLAAYEGSAAWSGSFGSTSSRARQFSTRMATSDLDARVEPRHDALGGSRR